MRELVIGRHIMIFNICLLSLNSQVISLGRQVFFFFLFFGGGGGVVLNFVDIILSSAFLALHGLTPSEYVIPDMIYKISTSILSMVVNCKDLVQYNYSIWKNKINIWRFKIEKYQILFYLQHELVTFPSDLLLLPASDICTAMYCMSIRCYHSWNFYNPLANYLHTLSLGQKIAHHELSCSEEIYIKHEMMLLCRDEWKLCFKQSSR